MNSKQLKTLQTIFADPVNGSIEWSKVEALLVSIGCNVIEGSGSSVAFERQGLRVRFHRPHPSKESLRYRIKDARVFLEAIGVKP